jgi:hypothetical protein
VALFWNVMSLPPACAEGFSAVYRLVLPEFPFLQNALPAGAASYSPILAITVDGLRRSGDFYEPEQWQSRLPGVRRTDRRAQVTLPWALTDSNRRPARCKRAALTT